MKYILNIMAVGSVATCLALLAIDQPGTEVSDMQAASIIGGCHVVTTPNCINCSGFVQGLGAPGSNISFEADFSNPKICCDTVSCAASRKNCGGNGS